MKKLLACDYGFILHGNAMAFCNGTDWDRPMGTCERGGNQTMHCDFEASNLCEWQSDGSAFEWKRRNGWVSFERLDYGPKHDHTVNSLLTHHCSMPSSNAVFFYCNFVFFVVFRSVDQSKGII